jgi:hypothetical protein
MNMVPKFLTMSPAVATVILLLTQPLMSQGNAQQAEVVPVRKVLNIVNFVRSADPRFPRKSLLEALRKEVELNLKYGFENTILLQYDALVDREMMAEALKSDKSKTEFGLWFEMSRPLNEAAGLPWKVKGRYKNWNWHWHINPGFLMAYTQAERKALIDAAFRRFKADFGYYPKSVGSWLLDSWSMDYMEKTYGVEGFCICREQDNTDAYGLRGGYSNGAYYPSKKNMLSAAVDMKNAVKAPVFKMLTPCPIYNYGDAKTLYPTFPYSHAFPPTMEPGWVTGYRPDVVDWFFRVYTEPKGLMNLSYMQTGQENSFTWKLISRGLPMQCERIQKEVAAGRIILEKMCDTACAFKAAHKENCPQTQIALEDWSGAGRKSVWYNSRFYRANLFLNEGKLHFRDIHKMADEFEEPFLNKVCTGWQALYYTPPVIDQWLFRGKSASGVMMFDGVFTSIETAAEKGDVLVATAKRTDGTIVTVRFEEGRIIVSGARRLTAEYGDVAFRKNISATDKSIDFVFQNFRYSVPFVGKIKISEKGFDIAGDKIELDMSKQGM